MDNLYKWTDNPMKNGIARCDVDITDECFMHLKYDKVSEISLPLFFRLLSDRQLSGDEIIGWLPQGSEFSKELYPDAYALVFEAFSSGTDTAEAVTYLSSDNTITSEIVSCKIYKGLKVVEVSCLEQINNLFEKTGSADYYVIDVINETVRLPRNDNFVSGTADVSAVNGFVEAGVPNIEGHTADNMTRSGAPGFSGAIKYDNVVSQALGGSGLRAGFGSFSIDASLSNPLYGNSTTVTPRHVKKFVYYKVGNTVINESLIDAGKVMSELALKADRDLSNINSAGKNNLIKNNILDYKNQVQKAVNTEHVADCPGVVRMFGNAYNNWIILNLSATAPDGSVYVDGINSSATAVLHCDIEVMKGTKYIAQIEKGTPQYFDLWFIPFKGGEEE